MKFVHRLFLSHHLFPTLTTPIHTNTCKSYKAWSFCGAVKLHTETLWFMQDRLSLLIFYDLIFEHNSSITKSLLALCNDWNCDSIASFWRGYFTFYEHRALTLFIICKQTQFMNVLKFNGNTDVCMHWWRGWNISVKLSVKDKRQEQSTSVHCACGLLLLG